MKYINRFKQFFKWLEPLGSYDKKDTTSYYKEIPYSNLREKMPMLFNQTLFNRLSHLIKERGIYKKSSGFKGGVYINKAGYEINFNTWTHYLKTQLPPSQFILIVSEYEDDWYSLYILGHSSYTQKKAFLCDQWEGLVKCLEDNNFISKK